MNPVSKVLRRAAAFTQTKKAADLKKTVASLSQTTTTTGTTVVAPSAKHLNAIPNATGAPVTTICLPPTQDLVKNLVDELQRKTLVNLTHIPIAEPISSQSVKEATASSAGPGKSISREAFLRTKYYEGFSKGHYDIKYFEDALKE